MKKAGAEPSTDEKAKARARSIADKYFTTEADGSPIDKDAAKPAAVDKRLTPKEFAFCQEYLVDLNGTQAAIRARYSAKTAAVIAYENLRKPHIARCIQELMKERSRATQWTAEKLLQRLGDELEADLLDIHDRETGALLPMDLWPLVWRQGLVEGLKVREELDDEGEVVSARIVEYKTASRSKLKEMIGKHVSVQAFKDKVEHDLTDPVKELYAQIAGVGIGPLAPAPAPGITPQPKPSAIRPVEPTNEDESANV